MTNTIAIRGGRVLRGNPLDARFEDTDVLVTDGRITAIGAVPEVPGAEEIDATGTFVLPGFVDAHHHLWETTMRGICADWDLNQFLWCIRFHHAALHQPEDIYAGTFAGAVSALDAGVTTSIDYMHCVNTPEHPEAGIQAVRDAGLRTVYCYGLNAVPVKDPWFRSTEARLADAKRVRAEILPSDGIDELVTFGIAVSDIGSKPFEDTVAEFKLVRELDVLLTTHTNCVWMRGAHPEIEWLNYHGLLTGKQLHAHGNCTTDAELDLLAEVGAAVVSTPEIELQMGNGFLILARAARKGVTAALGANIQANNSVDAFTQMRLARNSITARENQPVLESGGTVALSGTSLTCAQALFHATLDGARALGLGDITGSLETGKAADLILLRHDQLHHRPIVDPMATIVTMSRASDVDTVLVGGRVVKRGGRLLGDIAERAMSLADASFERLRPRMETNGGLEPEMPADVISDFLRGKLENSPVAAGPEQDVT